MSKVYEVRVECPVSSSISVHADDEDQAQDVARTIFEGMLDAGEAGIITEEIISEVEAEHDTAPDWMDGLDVHEPHEVAQAQLANSLDHYLAAKRRGDKVPHVNIHVLDAGEPEIAAKHLGGTGLVLTVEVDGHTYEYGPY